ncbi:MAG: hypothetical protein ACK59M_14330 [Pseudomonadota bacterium]|jgi:hypothetical protein
MARTARRPAWIGILLTVLAVAGIARAADDAASTPYAVLHAALSPALEVEGDPHLRAVQKIESKLANVAPRDIEVTIDARGGPIRVPVAADGRVAFPLRDDLLAENPPVRSNQPRGSLTVSVTLALASPRSTRVPVGEFSAALDAADAWLSRKAAAEGVAPPVVRGLELRFPPAAGASATLRGRSERLLLADGDGRIVLVRERDLVDGTREVELSQPPLEVVPWLAR